jgi:hypothetical protein
VLELCLHHWLDRCCSLLVDHHFTRLLPIAKEDNLNSKIIAKDDVSRKTKTKPLLARE